MRWLLHCVVGNSQIVNCVCYCLTVYLSMCLCEQIAALEMQKELALSQVEDWIVDAEKYLNFLRYCVWVNVCWQVCTCSMSACMNLIWCVLILDRVNPSQHHLHQQQKWEHNVAMVRSSLVGLKVRGGANTSGLQVKGVCSFSHSFRSFVFSFIE